MYGRLDQTMDDPREARAAMSGGDERHGTSVRVLLPVYAMVQAALKITRDLAQQRTSIFFIGWRLEVFARPRQTGPSS